MICKDCYHYGVCSKEDGTTNYYGKEDACADVEKRCQYFKDKSRIVELPCNIGDEAYYVSIKRYSPLSYKLVKVKVTDFYINNKNGIYAVEIKTLKSNFTFTLNICKVYFDKSKAEEKLKELNDERY